MLVEKVVVLKFPSWNGLITKPDGARVIVATWFAKPGALTVTWTVPVPSSAWMKIGVDELVEPALIGRVIWLLPWPVALVARSTRLGSALVTVTWTPPVGAGACRLNDVCTWRSRPMVCGLKLMAGVLTVAVIDRELAGVLKLKPVGVTTSISETPPATGSNWTFLNVSFPSNVTGLPTIVPTLEPPVGWSVAVTVTMTGARPGRRVWFVAQVRVGGIQAWPE